jgi:hypothetical protein
MYVCTYKGMRIHEELSDQHRIKYQQLRDLSKELFVNYRTFRSRLQKGPPTNEVILSGPLFLLNSQIDFPTSDQLKLPEIAK